MRDLRDQCDDFHAFFVAGRAKPGGHRMWVYCSTNLLIYRIADPQFPFTIRSVPRINRFFVKSATDGTFHRRFVAS